MLSIIISSYQPDYFTALEKNIAETCGMPYEIIKIDNPGVMGICEAYNKGAALAKFENLLFLHEDVKFETKDWGGILAAYLKKNNVGCVGLAGTDYIPNCPFAWWSHDENKYEHIIQYYNNGFYTEKNLLKDKEVFALDGVFMACRKNVYEKFKFDRRIKGFHGYDLNFSIRIANEYVNLVTNEISLIHYSSGNPNVDWFKSLVKTKPFFSSPKKQIMNKGIEKFYFNIFIFYLENFNLPISWALPYFKPQKFGYKLNKKFMIKLCKSYLYNLKKC